MGASICGVARAEGSPGTHAFSVAVCSIRSMTDCDNRSEDEQNIPPWDVESKAYQLYRELEDFESALPPDLAYSDRNTRIHSKQRATSTSYIIINLVIFLGTFLLHREYLPCHPWEKVCPKPIGPIEGPQFGDPPDPLYWDQSARRCFRAARDIVKFLHRCRELKILPETPFVAFCAWNATFAGIFPKPHINIFVG